MKENSFVPLNKPEMDNQRWSISRKQLFQGISLKCAQPSENRKGSQQRFYNFQTEQGHLIVFKMEKKKFQAPAMTIWH